MFSLVDDDSVPDLEGFTNALEVLYQEKSSSVSQDDKQKKKRAEFVENKEKTKR
jgi:hypothetical protein